MIEIRPEFNYGILAMCVRGGGVRSAVVEQFARILRGDIDILVFWSSEDTQGLFQKKYHMFVIVLSVELC